MNSRRIAAIYLPQLPCELAAVAKRPDTKVSLSQVSFGVVLVEPNAVVDPNQRLMSVSESARRLGIFEGQTLEEARAINAAFVVRELPNSLLKLGLERIIDSLRDFDLTIACEAPSTIWIDITGAAHLLGGEEALARELVERVRLLGHRARVAIASGPRLAQVFARAASFGGQSTLVVRAERARAQLADLPTVALPLERDAVTWLTRLGVLTLGDLLQLPRTELLDRLGASAERWLDLASGIDLEPLTLHPPAPVMTETFDWEEPTSALEALIFALRRLTVRLEARLSGRGVAAEHVHVVVKHDRATARHRGVSPKTELDFKLTVPLWHEDELRKVITARLERTPLGAPSVGIELSITSFTAALGKQLELSRLVAGFGSKAPAELGLDVLLSELTGDVGPANVGVLSLVDSFLPEKQGCLVCITTTETQSVVLQPLLGVGPARRVASRRHRAIAKRRTETQLILPNYASGATQSNLPRLRKARGHARIPNRLLRRPLLIESPLKIGGTLILDHEIYTIERLRFDHRLRNVEWWGDRPVSRDYLWMSLAGAVGRLEAFAYVDRETGKVFVQGMRD
jgi:protein ImuB